MIVIQEQQYFLYIYKAKHSNNEDEINNMNKYFSILGNAYCSLNQNTNNNLIYEYTNQFKKSFEYMISKLNALGFESDKFKISKILPFDENEMIFNLPEKGNFKIPESTFSKKGKKIKQNKNKNELEPQNKNNQILKKINKKVKPKKQIKQKYREEEKKENPENNKINIIDAIDNNIENENNINNIFDTIKNVILNEKEVHFTFNLPSLKMEMPKEIQKIYTDFNLDNNPINNKKSNVINVIQRKKFNLKMESLEKILMLLILMKKMKLKP